MEKPESIYSHMLIDNDKIIAIGNDDLSHKLTTSDTIIDLCNKTVLPGFYDSHLHLISTFLNEYALNFESASSINDVLDIIKNYPNKDDHKIILGKRLSEFNLLERRLPTKRELDTVSPDFPLVISSIEFHTVVMNSYAMNLFNIPFTIGGFEKDEFNNFTGRVRNRGAFIALKKVYSLLDESIYKKGLESTFNAAITRGVTTMITVEGGPLFHGSHPDIIHKNKDTFPIDVELFYSTTDFKKILHYNLNRIGGDIFLDGSFRSQNAAMYQPYSDTESNVGKLFFNEQELYEFIEHAHDLNLQIAIHAVGPRAIDFLLDTYEKVLQNKPRKDHRHRIEHFELPLPSQIKRAKKLNLVLAMHPTYEFFFREEGMMYDTRLGKERASMTNPFKAIVDEGIVVAGCSDSDVMPIDPLLGIHSAVNHTNINSRISPYDAIKMFTINGAYSIFQESVKGSLKVGKIADFIILDHNPLTINHEKIKDITILNTYKNGKMIYNGVNDD